MSKKYFKKQPQPHFLTGHKSVEERKFIKMIAAWLVANRMKKKEEKGIGNSLAIIFRLLN
jgi:hypothetical protein